MASDEVSKPSSLPSYSEMILEAIESLDEKEGSNKSSIGNYIESKYGEQLPEAHASLLSAHLQRMKEVGELVMVKNSYMRPDPNSPTPLKRGRGRPPKPKPELPPGAVLPPPRPRGRPPKDPVAAAVAKAAAGHGPAAAARPRGRPPKKARVAVDAGDAAAGDDGGFPAVVIPLSSGGKRGRGRPPKVKPPFADVGFA